MTEWQHIFGLSQVCFFGILSETGRKMKVECESKMARVILISTVIVLMIVTMSWSSHWAKFQPINLDLSTSSNSTKIKFQPLELNLSTLKKKTETIKKLASREYEQAEMDCRVLPDILLVGMEKCGTATLRTFLGIHPQIYVPQPLQPAKFFNWGNKKLTLLEYFKLTQGQKRPMHCTPNGMLRIEKSLNSCPASRTYQYIPKAKLIAIVREPSERTLSHFVHFLGGDTIPENTTFEEALNTEEYFRKIIYWSLYADRMQKYADVYGAENFHVIDGDIFAKDPVSELRKVETFVGIENVISQEDFLYNEKKHFYCLKNDAVGCMGRSKGRPHPVMQNETRRKLKDFLRPYNERFYKMVGRRFPWDD